MKAKKFIPLSILALIGAASLAACGANEPAASSTSEPAASSTSEPAASSTSEPAASTSEPDSTPASSSDDEVHYTSVSITNKEELQTAWYSVETGRTVSVSLDPAGNVSVLLRERRLTVTSSDTNVAVVNGLVVTPVAPGKATITVSIDGVSDSVEVTIQQLIVSDIKDVNQAGFWAVEGIITAKTTQGFILHDNTGSIYIYLKATPSDYEIGDYYRVYQTLEDGKYQPFNGFYQFTSGATITKIDAIEGLTQPEAVDLTADILSGCVGTSFTQDKLVKYKWTSVAGKSGTYSTLNLDGSNIVIEPTYTPSSFEITEGQKYEVEAFFYGYNSQYSYVSVALTELTLLYDTATSIEVSSEFNIIPVGGTNQFEATVLPSTAHQEITWSIANKDASVTEALATIDDEGLVTGVKAGTVVVTAQATNDPDIKKDVEIEVADAAALTEFSLSASSLNVMTGATKTLEPSFKAAGETYISGVKWSSSDETVATVADGVVTGVKAGTATITATTEGKDANGNALTATCEVTVVAANVGTAEAPISVSDLISVAPQFCEQVNSSYYTDAKAYVKGVVTSASYSSKFNNWTIIIADENDSSVTIQSTGVVLTSDQTICKNDTVVLANYLEYFKGWCLRYYEKDYGSLVSRTPGQSSITVTGAENATVTGLKETYVNDETATFTVTPASGYQVSKVEVNGEALTAGDDGYYSFVVSGDMTVALTIDPEGTKTATELPFSLHGAKSGSGVTSVFTVSSDSLSATYEASGVTFLLEKNTSSGNIGISGMLGQDDHIRVYQNAKLTVSISSGTLAYIKYTCKSASNKGAQQLAGATWDGATAVQDDVTVTATPTSSSATSISFVASVAQVQISSVAVGYYPAE